MANDVVKALARRHVEELLVMGTLTKIDLMRIVLGKDVTPLEDVMDGKPMKRRELAMVLALADVDEQADVKIVDEGGEYASVVDVSTHRDPRLGDTIELTRGW